MTDDELLALMAEVRASKMARIPPVDASAVVAKAEDKTARHEGEETPDDGHDRDG